MKKRRCRNLAKRFSKKYGNKGWAFNYLQSESYVKMPVKALMDPYIIASKNIVNILLSGKFRHGTLIGL